MALSSTPSLTQINAELGTFGQSLSKCIALAKKTGIWTKQSNFASYSAPYLLVNYSSFVFSSAFGSKALTVTSNTTWSVSDNMSWITISGASGSDNDSFTITCAKNLSSSSRIGTVTISWSGTNIAIEIFQEGDSGGCVEP